MMVTWIMMQIH